MPRITKRFVDAAKPTAADVVYWDDDLAGFGLRVRPSGARSFVFAYRTGGGRRGRQRKMTLGTVGNLTPDGARKAAQDASNAVGRGKDPAADKMAQRADMAVAELIEIYLRDGPASRPAKKASSWASDAANLRRHVAPRLGRRLVGTLTKADGERLQADISAGRTRAPVTAAGAKRRGRVRVTGGKAVAARATAAFRAMLTWAVDRKHAKANPLAGIRLNKLKGRERILSDAELARLSETAAAMEAEGVNAKGLTIVRLLALTGARRDEVASLRRGFLDFDRGVARLPDSKTDEKIIPLGAPALAMLAAWLERSSGDRDDYVFPAERGDGHYQGTPKVWRDLRKRARLPGVRLHDLRHGFASIGVGMGQSLFIVGKMIGHRRTQTTERYAHMQADPVRVAADQVARRVADAMRGDKGAANVATIARRR